MPTTPRTTLDRPAARGSLTVSSFDRVRTARGPSMPAASPRPGSSPARDPRGDLQMFDLIPVAPVGEAVSIDELAPLLPPVISEPPRSRPAAGPALGARRRPPTTRTPVRPSAPARRGRVRLTLRGYVVALGLGVAALAGISVLSNAHSEAAISVPAAQVVVQPGESLQDVASRAADGRAVAEVAAEIRQANGLTAEMQPEAGEILLVPGS